MAKKEVGEQKANLYLLAIVAIVAVVGIVVLVLNSAGVSVSDDLSGQAIRTGLSPTTACRDCPDNCQYNVNTAKYSCFSTAVTTTSTSTTTSVDSGTGSGCTNCEPPNFCDKSVCIKV